MFSFSMQYHVKGRDVGFDDIGIAERSWDLHYGRFRWWLGDIREEGAVREGCDTVEVNRASIDIYGGWNLDLIVWMYEFKVHQ